MVGAVGKGMIAAGAQSLAKTFGIGGVGPNTLIGEIDTFEVEGLDSVNFDSNEAEY